MTLSYGVNGRHKVNWHRPKYVKGALPTIILIHGGSWNGNDETSKAATANALAARGFGVACMTYRYAPGTQYPGQVNDVQACLDYIKLRSDVDANRICVWGYSAGGFMAGWLAVTGKAKCLVNNFAITDVRGFGAGSVADMLGSANAATASPILSLDGNVCPSFLSHGTSDTTVPPAQSTAWRDASLGLGVHSEYWPYAGGHGEPADGGVADNLLAAQIKFLHERL